MYIYKLLKKKSVKYIWPKVMSLTYDSKLGNWPKKNAHMSNGERSIYSNKITRIPKRFW